MLIVSKFHDYYDTAIGYGGIDKTCVYRRKIVEKEIDYGRKGLYSHIDIDNFHKGKLDYYVSKNVIGFAGDIYPFYRIEKKMNAGYSYEKIENFYIYNAEEMIDFIRKEKIGEWDKKRSSRFYVRLSDRTVKEFFAEDRRSIKKYFREYKTPVFLIGHRWPAKTILIINPILRKSQFARCKDPFTAYQEIYMYLSGVLGTNEKETVKISDKVMLKKKGFDKWSFKKRPHKKGKKK